MYKTTDLIAPNYILGFDDTMISFPTMMKKNKGKWTI